MRTLFVILVFLMASVNVTSAKPLKDNDLRNIIILKGDLITEWKEGSYTFKSFLYKKSFYVCLFGMDGNSAVVQCFDEKR
jgi:hypothetical protein